MSVSPNSRKILLLYKDLLRYGKNIQLTDKEYYVSRVRKEFRQNKTLENPEDIEFQYMKGLTLLKNRHRSNVPVVAEIDIEEQFIRGHGPGGQAVNKTNNCVVLRHAPSGIVIKCHQTRSLEQNRKLARQLLVARLDERINGENSIANQKKRIDEQRSRQQKARRAKKREMKEEWKAMNQSNQEQPPDSE